MRAKSAKEIRNHQNSGAITFSIHDESTEDYNAMKRSTSFDVLLSCFLVLLKKLMYCCVLKKGNWLVFDVLRSDLLSKFFISYKNLLCYF